MKIERLKDGKDAWRISLSIEVEKNVSRLRIFEYQMRFGSAMLKMGGIAGVGTDENHRMKGYSRRVMEDSTVFMMEAGFDVAMLFGIADFYPKFGYATVLPESTLTLNTADAQAAVQSHTVRKFERDALPKVLEIFATNNVGHTGTVVRDVKHWKEFKMGSSFQESAAPFVVQNDADEVIGYFVVDDTNKHCTLSEIGFQDRSIFSSVVHFLGERAWGIGQEGITCFLPANHEFAVFCRRYGCRMNVRYPKDSTGMMRIINQSSTFDKIKGELGRRLQHSEWQGEIIVATELGESGLEIDRGHVEHTPLNEPHTAHRFKLPQDKLAQLMMGRRNIEDLAVDDDVQVDAEIIPVLGTLFPMRDSYIWWPNRF